MIVSRETHATTCLKIVPVAMVFTELGEFNKQIVYAKQPKWEDEDTTSLLKWDVDPFLQDGAPSR